MVRQTSAALGHRLVGWANYDFCPGLNRYFRWLRHPLTWLVIGAISAGLIGAFVAPQVWFLSGGAALVALVGVIWPKLAVSGVRGTLKFARDRCHEHDSTVVTLAVENRWPWPIWGLVVERRFLNGGDPEDEGELFALAKLPAWSRGEFEFPFTPSRRGEYPAGTPCLSTGFPFGIWSARRELSIGTRLLVWPQIIRLKSTPLAGGAGWAANVALQDRAGDEGETMSSRPYQQGDSLRKVHWAHTARRDALMVRERQSPLRRQALVTLHSGEFADPACGKLSSDVGTSSYGGAVAPLEPSSASTSSLDSPPTADVLFDRAVRIVASVVHVLHDHGWDVQCRIDDELSRVGAGSRGLRPLLDRLARLSPITLASTAVVGQERTALEPFVIRITRGEASHTPPFAARHTGRFRGKSRVVDISAAETDFTADAARHLVRRWEEICHDE